MKFGMKKAVAMIMAAIVVTGCFDTDIYAISDKAVGIDESYQNDLLEGYIDKLVEETSQKKSDSDSVEALASDRGDSLTGLNSYMYSFLKERIEQVAKGKLDSTVFETGTISPGEGNYRSSFSGEDLGTEDLTGDEAVNKAVERTGLDMRRVMSALLSDLPYDLYWYDKISGIELGLAPEISIQNDNLVINSLSLTISMAVAKTYSSTGITNSTSVDTAKTSAATTAVENALSVVELATAKGCDTDYKKLKYYKDYICNATDYDYASMRGHADYGDPWQVIYVFDGDASTKVVCEGYSKAFKMLCDLTEFSYYDLDCYLMTGTMNTTGNAPENHMWNVVHMNDGKNYMADLTVCDNDLRIADDRVFMVGYTSFDESGYKGYTIHRPQLDLGDDNYWVEDDVIYSYSEDCYNDFTDSERQISSSDYDATSIPDAPSVDYTQTFRGEDFWVDGCGYKLLTSNTVSFVNGTNLKKAKVTIPSKISYGGKEYTVTSIGGAAFSLDAEDEFHNGAFYKENKWLEEVTIPDTVKRTEDYINNNWTYYGSFSHCVNLYKVNLPDTLEELGIMTFCGCKSLTQIDLPDSLLTIGQNTFEDTGLISLNIPAKCTSIDLPRNDTIREINVDKNNKDYYSVDGVLFAYYYKEWDTGIEHHNYLIFYPIARKGRVYNVPEGTQEIGFNSFMYNKTVKTINLPKTIVQTGEFEGQLLDGIWSTYNAFKDSVIEEINIDPDNEFYTSVDGVLYSKDMKSLVAYPPAKQDKIFFVTDTVERLGGFDHNEYLEELYVPSSVNYLLDGSTEWMKNLKKLVFSANSELKRITCYMTLNNYEMESICIPSSVKCFTGLQTFCGNKIRQVYFADGAVWDAVETKDPAGNFSELDDIRVYGHGTDNGVPELVAASKSDRSGIEYIDVTKTQLTSLLGLTFDNTYIQLKAGEKKNLSVCEYPYHIDGINLKYESSNNSVATVDADGNVEAIAAGKCYITVSAMDGSGEYARCMIHVDDGKEYKPAVSWNKDTETGEYKPDVSLRCVEEGNEADSQILTVSDIVTGSEIIKEAGCTEKGEVKYIVESFKAGDRIWTPADFDDSGIAWSYSDKDIGVKGHKWEYSVEWIKRDDSSYFMRVHATCENDPAHVIDYDADVAYEDLEPATSSKTGIRKYTAKYNKLSKDTDIEFPEYLSEIASDSLEVKIDMLEHDYKISVKEGTFDENSREAVVVIIDKNDPDADPVEQAVIFDEGVEDESGTKTVFSTMVKLPDNTVREFAYEVFNLDYEWKYSGITFTPSEDGLKKTGAVFYYTGTATDGSRANRTLEATSFEQTDLSKSEEEGIVRYTAVISETDAPDKTARTEEIIIDTKTGKEKKNSEAAALEEKDEITWNLFYEKKDGIIIHTGGANLTDKDGRLGTNSGKSVKFYDVELSGTDLKVMLKKGANRADAAKADNSIIILPVFDENGAEIGQFTYSLPISYEKPLIKLAVTSGNIKSGLSGQELKTVILEKKSTGAFEPLDLSNAVVSYEASVGVGKESGEIVIRPTSSVQASKIRVKLPDWSEAIETTNKFAVKMVSKDVITATKDGTSFKTIILNNNVDADKAQNQQIEVFLNGSNDDVEVSKICVKAPKNEKNGGFIIDGIVNGTLSGSKLTIKYPATPSAMKKGTYNYTLSTADGGKLILKIVVSSSTLSNAVKFNIKTKLNSVTGQKMVIEPALSGISGKITDVTFQDAEQILEAEYDEERNLIYVGVQTGKEIAANTKINQPLTVIIDDEIKCPILLKTTVASTKPTVKIDKISLPKTRLVDADGTANVLAFYKLNKKMIAIAPLENGVRFTGCSAVNDETLGKGWFLDSKTGAKVRFNEDGTISVHGAKKAGKIKVEFSFKGGVKVTTNLQIIVNKNR